MEFLNTIKNLIPDYAKDIRLNLDGTIARSSLEGNDAVGVALAAAFAAKSKIIVDAIRNAGVLSPEELNGALTAAAPTPAALPCAGRKHGAPEAAAAAGVGCGGHLPRAAVRVQAPVGA
jgi:hypothetical protein